MATAYAGMRSALALCELLLTSDLPAEAPFGVVAGLANCYARPFTNSRLGALGKRYEHFGEDRELAAFHRLLRGLRNQIYAHNDNSEGWARQVVLLPPVEWAERGSATYERVLIGGEEALTAVADLCQLQMERLLTRLKEVIDEVFGKRSWSEDEVIWISDHVRDAVRILSRREAPWLFE